MSECLNNISLLPKECYPIEGELCLFEVDGIKLYLRAEITIQFITGTTNYKDSIIDIKHILNKGDIDPLQQYMFCINAKINNVDSIKRMAITEGRCRFNTEINQIEFMEYNNQDKDIDNYILYTWNRDPEERVIL